MFLIVQKAFVVVMNRCSADNVGKRNVHTAGQSTNSTRAQLCVVCESLLRRGGGVRRSMPRRQIVGILTNMTKRG